MGARFSRAGCADASEYRDWIARHGFSLEKIYPVSKGKNYLVARAG